MKLLRTALSKAKALWLSVFGDVRKRGGGKQ
jgi:hypothetical protein